MPTPASGSPSGAPSSGSTSSGVSSGSPSSGVSSGSPSSGASGAPTSDASVPTEAGTKPPAAQPGDVSVTTGSPLQTMDGFGASDAWESALTSSQVTLLFNPDKGIGLSLLRVGIDTDGTPMGAGAVSDAKGAAAFGVKVWGAPWSPPAASKGNDDVNCTSSTTAHLNSSAYGSWSDTLAAFPAAFYKQSGVQIMGNLGPKRARLLPQHLQGLRVHRGRNGRVHQGPRPQASRAKSAGQALGRGA